MKFSTITVIGLALGLFSCNSPDKAPSGPVWFFTDVAGLNFATSPQNVDLQNGDTLRLEAAPVKKVFKGREVRMLAYNGSIPGPIIRVPQGGEIVVILKNSLGFPTSLHSHGVRLDFLMDGAAGFSQPAIADGASFAYHIRFPDPGIFWYHPHSREDYSQEMGLYGNFLVKPTDSAFWHPVNREETVILDDFYLDPATGTAPFRQDEVTYVMMGRFGNLYMANGDTAYSLDVKRNEVVRFYLTNAANTRVFNVGFTPDTSDTAAYLRMKLVGSDNGKYEYDMRVATEMLSPSERIIVEVRFDSVGTYFLTQETRFPRSCYGTRNEVSILGRVNVLSDTVATDYGTVFARSDSSLETIRSIDSVRAEFDSIAHPVDKILVLTGVMGPMVHNMAPLAMVSAAQPDPGDIVGKCVEWYDVMPVVASQNSTTQNMRWIIRDSLTGLENHDINWRFRVGNKVKIRIVNDPRSAHPMAHPIHFHGQRFLVLSANGYPNRNMVWKDTYLVGTNQVVDILLDASNPGGWMAHCHIAEHMEGMMMFPFFVDP